MRAIGRMYVALALAAPLLLAGCGNGDPATDLSAVLSSTLQDPASGATCSGKDLDIAKDNSRLVIDGACAAVVISASQGSLNLDTARSIRVDGSHFTVLNSQVGDVVVTGNHNTLNLTDVGTVEIRGNDNLVLGRIQHVRFIGDRNTVNPHNQPTLDDRGSGNKLM